MLNPKLILNGIELIDEKMHYYKIFVQYFKYKIK